MKKLPLIFLSVLILALYFPACSSEEEYLPPSTEIFETEIDQTSVTDPVPGLTETEPYEARVKTAEKLYGYYSVYVDHSEETAKLTDEDRSTYSGVGIGQEFRIESDVEFSSIYIIWGSVPGNYELITDSTSLTGGQNRFLHECIFLPEPTTSVAFAFSDEGKKTVCDVVLLSDGELPGDIQVWQAPTEDADILVFPTHSDDDVLFFGALLSYYAIERQMDIQCAFMVNHTMRPERDHERLDGLWEMGIRRYPVVGYHPDSPISDTKEAFLFYSAYQIQRWQTEQIRRFRPLVVVGHDLKGEYGNGGHKVNAYFLTEAVCSAADPNQYPDSAQHYGVWDTPKLYLHLYPENRITLDVNLPLSSDPQGRTPFEIAQDAYQYHVSQHHLPYQVRQGEEWAVYDCTVFGLYRTLVGHDSGNDIMENICRSDWR